MNCVSSFLIIAIKDTKHCRVFTTYKTHRHAVWTRYTGMFLQQSEVLLAGSIPIRSPRTPLSLASSFSILPVISVQVWVRGGVHRHAVWTGDTGVCLQPVSERGQVWGPHQQLLVSLYGGLHWNSLRVWWVCLPGLRDLLVIIWSIC